MLCENCKKKPTCTQICPALARELDRKPSDRLYSDRWIRAKEVPYAPEHFDEMLPLQAIDRIKGRKKKKYTENE